MAGLCEADVMSQFTSLQSQYKYMRTISYKSSMDDWIIYYQQMTANQWDVKKINVNHGANKI